MPTDSFAEMSSDQRSTWAAGLVLDQFVTGGRGGLKAVCHAIMATAMKDAYDRGVTEGRRLQVEEQTKLVAAVQDLLDKVEHASVRSPVRDAARRLRGLCPAPAEDDGATRGHE